jgi:thiol-disulfide isomerase/thioredoxin
MRRDFISLAVLLLLCSHTARSAAPTGPSVGSIAPDFKVRNLVTGEDVSLSSQQGKVVILTFWASWCGPCKRELPVLENAQRVVGKDKLDHIGVVFVTTAYALEMRLRWPIRGCYPIAVGTRPARIVRRHRDQHCTIPVHLVLQLAAELGPALVKNGFVQTRLGSNMPTCLLRVACRAGHIAHLQVLDTHHRVVFADEGRGLVQEIAPAIADSGVDALHSPPGCCDIVPSRASVT